MAETVGHYFTLHVHVSICSEINVALLQDDGRDKALKSSQAFFSQLQDQVKMQIKDAKKIQKKPKKRELSAQKLKL